jgi:hypothetical protein
VFPSQDRSLLREWNASSSALSHCPFECSYISLASSPNKKRRKRLTGSISRVTGSQNTDLHIGEESAVTAETSDIGIIALAVLEVVGEAGCGAGGETGQALGEGGGGCDCESGEDEGVLHFECLFGRVDCGLWIVDFGLWVVGCGFESCVGVVVS